MVGALVRGEDLGSRASNSCPSERERRDEAPRRPRGCRGARPHGSGGGSSAAPMLPRYVRHVSTPVGTSESTAVSFVDTQAVARSGMQVGQGVLSIGGHAPRERRLIRTAIVRDVVLDAVVSCQPSAPTSPHFVARALCKGQWRRRVRAHGQRWSGVRHADMPRRNTHLNSQRLEPQASIDRAILGRPHPPSET